MFLTFYTCLIPSGNPSRNICEHLCPGLGTTKNRDSEAVGGSQEVSPEWSWGIGFRTGVRVGRKALVQFQGERERTNVRTHEEPGAQKVASSKSGEKRRLKQGATSLAGLDPETSLHLPGSLTTRLLNIYRTTVCCSLEQLTCNECLPGPALNACCDSSYLTVITGL